MKNIGSEKSSVAWFRLAECLKRKERERAFLLYRLLMHSFEDNAFLKKLEGDMWIDFDLEEATTCYLAAAHHYKQRHEYYEAYLIYKKLSEIDGQSLMFIDLVIEVISHTPFRNEASCYYAKKLSGLCRVRSFAQAVEYFEEHKQIFSHAQKNDFYQEFVKNAIAAQYPNTAVIESYLQAIIEHLFESHQDNSLYQFLTQLQSLHEKWYQKAKLLLEKHF